MTAFLLMRNGTAIALLLMSSSSIAATITVDGVQCSLVDAITAANSDTAVGGCTKGVQADTLKLTAAVFNITLSNNDTDGPNGLPSIKTAITIDGKGAVIQRAVGVSDFRLFHVASGGNLTLKETTVRNGVGAAQSIFVSGKGGGIYNRGVVKLDKSVIKDNSATRTGCCASRGGGIQNVAGANITIINSIVADNRATLGGGLSNEGDSTLWHATFSNNSAYQGGGIYLSNLSTLTLNNSLVANSTEGKDCINNAGSILYKGVSLIEDGSCGVAAGGGLAADPKLRPLLDNGGRTKSYALKANSPAKNSGGTATCQTLDQRGASRPQGAICDIGAFELVSPAHSSVQPLITFFNAAVSGGQLVGTGALPAAKINRREAVRHQILLAGNLVQQHKSSSACRQLKIALRRIDTDNTIDGNDYVTGSAGDELAKKIQDLRVSLGCQV
ncbi:MAG: choice-of-anchor Q domain-containing protein [Gammaproteobacteria bacterium]